MIAHLVIVACFVCFSTICTGAVVELPKAKEHTVDVPKRLPLPPTPDDAAITDDRSNGPHFMNNSNNANALEEDSSGKVQVFNMDRSCLAMWREKTNTGSAYLSLTCVNHEVPAGVQVHENFRNVSQGECKAKRMVSATMTVCGVSVGGVAKEVVSVHSTENVCVYLTVRSEAATCAPILIMRSVENDQGTRVRFELESGVPNPNQLIVQCPGSASALRINMVAYWSVCSLVLMHLSLIR